MCVRAGAHACTSVYPVKPAALWAMARQSVATQRAAAGGRHLPALRPSLEAASFSPGAGITPYFSAYSRDANIRSAGTAAR